MKRTSFSHTNCSIARALEVVGEWWTILVLREAFLGTRRFEDFQERLGIARNVLASRLRHLVRHGVLARSRYQERPSRHEYWLTDKGRDLFPVIVALMSWGDRWATPPGGPPVVLSERTSGKPLAPRLVCGKTGKPIELASTLATPGPGADARTRRRLEEIAKNIRTPPRS